MIDVIRMYQSDCNIVRSEEGISSFGSTCQLGYYSKIRNVFEEDVKFKSPVTVCVVGSLEVRRWWENDTV